MLKPLIVAMVVANGLPRGFAGLWGYQAVKKEEGSQLVSHDPSEKW